MMCEKHFILSFKNTGCSDCLFLTLNKYSGYDCRLLKKEIQEDKWSNIDYMYDRYWRYNGCPLIYKENLNDDLQCILNLEEFKCFNL